jgi:hypothetical protein
MEFLGPAATNIFDSNSMTNSPKKPSALVFPRQHVGRCGLEACPTTDKDTLKKTRATKYHGIATPLDKELEVWQWQ